MEGDLIERARAGDVEAFEALASSRIEHMYRIALGITGQHADAMDVTQEALVSMWRGLSGLRDPATFDGWLYRITLNASKVARRRRRRRLREIPLSQGTVQDSRDAAAVTQQTRSAFDRAFERLSVDQRALLLQHHGDGMRIADLAHLLGVPEGTVKSRLHSARAALDRALERERP